MLQLYPPFLFLGVRIDSLSADGTELTTSLPLRWYATNFHGTHFGGSLCAWSDPFPALLCARLIPDVEVWTKDHRVEFRRPARGRLTLRVKVGETDLEEIKRQLDTAGKATRTFECPITDASGTVVARVTNTAYVRRRPKRSEPVGDRG
jgi:acyl-coenzyme A thioesterase PaaI-like protein